MELYTGCASSGQGHETVMAQILADELGIPFEWMRVFHGTTSLVDEGYGTYHSRAVVVGGSAITVAADRRWSSRCAPSPPGARASIRPSSSGGPATSTGAAGHGEPPVLSLAALAAEGSAEAEAALEAVGRFRPGSSPTPTARTSPTWPSTRRPGEVEVLRFVAVEDVGRAINPLLVHGQAIGAAVQGLGGAFLERLVYDEAGQLVTGTFADYAMPTSRRPSPASTPSRSRKRRRG